ncbi:DUF3267 domain-containing protein [Acutalibacter sp.]|jgi:hypothetical protein|uniref:DUF3267 domain-containing protein n=1 Tax=Acutalibacter sp. TaxID=1918636 RepID=UPI002172D14C|nr:DUF3267 domain-containing protein [Acutalibacter sp.]
MKLHYHGKYNQDPASIPHGEHRPGAVPFREFQSAKSLAIAANLASFFIVALLLVPAVFRTPFYGRGPQLILGFTTPLAALVPHELLHALCFKGDVYFYTNLSQGMLFVAGPEDMSKSRFVFMSLLPNLVFGFVPYLLGMLFGVPFLLAFGALSAGMGAADYFNAFNALTQMPKGARTYLYQFNSFWYLPE